MKESNLTNQPNNELKKVHSKISKIGFARCSKGLKGFRIDYVANADKEYLVTILCSIKELDFVLEDSLLDYLKWDKNVCTDLIRYVFEKEWNPTKHKNCFTLKNIHPSYMISRVFIREV